MSGDETRQKPADPSLVFSRQVFKLVYCSWSVVFCCFGFDSNIVHRLASGA